MPGPPPPKNAVYRGRPLTPERAFTNFDRNAAKYGKNRGIELAYKRRHCLAIRDAEPWLHPFAIAWILRSDVRGERETRIASGGRLIAAYNP